jgi:hypothetical protein
MATIREQLYARCPFGKAPTYLDFYLDSLARDATGEEGVLRLSVPLADLGIPGGLVVARDVEARFSPLDGEGFGPHATAVEWSPVGDGPYPKFVGVLTVEAEEGYGTCALTLEGDYEPPFGALGEAFDAALGRRIAIATARKLLHELRGALETACLERERSIP